MTSQNEPIAVLPMGKEDFKDWLKYHLLTSGLLDEVAYQLYDHMAVKAQQQMFQELQAKIKKAKEPPHAPGPEPGPVTILNNPPVLNADARMPGESQPGQEAGRMPISQMQGSSPSQQPAPRQGGMTGESSLASEKQLSFVKNIRDALGFDKPTDEQLEHFTKDQASFFIDEHLAAFRNKSHGKKAGAAVKEAA